MIRFFIFLKIIVVLVIRFFVFKNYDVGDSVFHFFKNCCGWLFGFSFSKKIIFWENKSFFSPVSRCEIVGQWYSAHGTHFESRVSLALLADNVTLATLQIETLKQQRGVIKNDEGVKERLPDKFSWAATPVQGRQDTPKDSCWELFNRKKEQRTHDTPKDSCWTIFNRKHMTQHTGHSKS